MAQFLRNMICKNNLGELLDNSFSYVICNDTGDELEELFYRSIEENKENFVIFKNDFTQVPFPTTLCHIELYMKWIGISRNLSVMWRQLS